MGYPYRLITGNLTLADCISAYEQHGLATICHNGVAYEQKEEVEEENGI